MGAIVVVLLLALVLAAVVMVYAAYPYRGEQTPVTPRLGDAMRRELQTTIDRILDITGHSRLLETYPEGRLSLEARNPYIDPISLLQIELLRRLRQAGDEDPPPEVWEAFVMTVNGIAAGMRNTG